MGTGDAIGEVAKKNCLPSLRRNYPVQVQRVYLSQKGSSSKSAPRGQGKTSYFFLFCDM